MTEVGFSNGNGQAAVRTTSLAGNLPGPKPYVLRCDREGCGYEYGALGCDIQLRRCPRHRAGAPALPFEGLE